MKAKIYVLEKHFNGIAQSTDLKIIEEELPPLQDGEFLADHDHVGQIAKLKGCKVISITGTDEKGQWLVSELGFDNFINYRTTNVLSALQEYAPEGVNCYFENVGGEISSAVISCLNKFRRISVCGSISVYNSTSFGANNTS
ncbi:hypothetical protein FQA39_LY10766 [Lamprigera yunnana]|nr:hypothetical protein FQA39_LY10766 [Lamprigera yunnana]